MIGLFDDSLFLKSVAAPYVSNVCSARHMNVVPWGLKEAGAVFKPGGSIASWTQTSILRRRKAQPTECKCMFKGKSSYCSEVGSSVLLFYFKLTMLLQVMFRSILASVNVKSTRTKQWKPVSLFPLLSWGSILVNIIGSWVLPLSELCCSTTVQTSLEPVSHISHWIFGWPDCGCAVMRRLHLFLEYSLQILIITF